MFQSLSSRLLLLTISFVMLAEVLIFIPSIAQYRRSWLEDHLASGQIAGLALEAAADERLSPELESELLSSAMVRGVILQREKSRMLMLAEDMPPSIGSMYDLRNASIPELIIDAVSLAFNGPEGVIQVTGHAMEGSGDYVAVLVDERELYDAMALYGRNILLLSIVISAITALLLYITLRRMFLRPMENITSKMVAFSKAPEDTTRIIRPSDRTDEIGTAERELESMQVEINQALVQKTHLANLGEAMSKINHDLRNILTTMQLVSDRLGRSEDPRVQSLSGNLMSGIDRAVNLCTQTLAYGKATSIVPRPILFELAPIADEVGHSLGLDEETEIRFVNVIDGDFQLYADPDQVFRALLNLARNAAEAIEDEDEEGTITISARSAAGYDMVDIEDTGPGLPPEAKENMFKPFQGSTRQGGTGLGLPNVLEIVAAHGGEVMLTKSDETGTIFCLSLPHPADAA